MALDTRTFDSKPWSGIGPNCQLIFHLLGEQTVNDVFTSPFYEVLENCEAKVPGAGPPPSGSDYIESAKVQPIQQGVQQLAHLFQRTSNVNPSNPTSKEWAQTTLVDLIRGDVRPDLQIKGSCAGLKVLGCFLVFDQIPDGVHYRSISLINNYGFLDPAGFGGQPLKVLLTTNKYRLIARKAKQAGILRVLAYPFTPGEVVRRPRGAAPIGEGNGKCCNGGSCQDVGPGVDPDDFYCESVDPENDPNGPCNSLADPCI